MGSHIVDGQFQSDKYPTCPPGKVPLSVKDPTAQELLWEYAQRRREVDAEFTDDLECALKAAGFAPPATCWLPNTKLHQAWGEGWGAGWDASVRNRGRLERSLYDELEVLRRRVAELEALINTPTIDDWIEGVRLEAAHQQDRWGSEHDAGKTDPDWFWLVGYLAGKALFARMQGNLDKAKHHTISTGAALLNWWRHIMGEETRMRPGIEPPKGGRS